MPDDDEEYTALEERFLDVVTEKVDDLDRSTAEELLSYIELTGTEPDLDALDDFDEEQPDDDEDSEKAKAAMSPGSLPRALVYQNEPGMGR